MNRPICIYHGGCDDGFGAAFSVWKRYGNLIEYFPGVYQSPPPDVLGRDVIIVDFSYKRPVMEELCAKANSVVMLDHHLSAMKDLEGLVPWAAARGYDVSITFDMNQSGAMLAWRHFHPDEPAPPLIEYIQDRDLFRKALPQSDQVTYALRSYPHDFMVWYALDVNTLMAEGQHILRYYWKLVDDLRNNVVYEMLGGYSVPTVNANYAFASDLAGVLSKGHPFAACYFYSPGGKSYSLRSQADGIDVSEIAKLYGGGGHAHAAGFRIPDDRIKK